jgi:hypothetical protein
LKRILQITFVALVFLYVCDYLLVRYRVAKGQKPFGTVQVLTYSAVPEKNNREEFFYGDPETEECIHSLFPHFGDAPCWYAGKSREKRTDL